jgi:hypothetical protein
MRRIFLAGVLILLLAISAKSETLLNPAPFSFTYTASETLRIDSVYNSFVELFSELTNTGMQSDSYEVAAVINWTVTPSYWEFLLCDSGGCLFPGVLADTLFLKPSYPVEILVGFKAIDWAGTGEATMKVTSLSDTTMNKTITFRYTAQAAYTCGDVNEDEVVDIGDIVFLINYVFYSGTPPSPVLNHADVNSDWVVDIGDIVYLINYVFYSGTQPVCN